MLFQSKPSVIVPLSLIAFLSAFLFTVSPAFSKKIKNDKVLSEAARSCHDIDSKIKLGSLSSTFWAEIEGEVGKGQWVSFGSKEDAEKKGKKVFWREAWAYQEANKVRLVEIETKTPTKEWVQKISYYFREDGTLEKAHSDFRTFGAYEKKKGPEHQFLANILRDRFYDGQGKCVKRSTPRITNATNRQGAHDVVFTDGPWPFYPDVSRLPFPALAAVSQDLPKTK